MKDDHSQLQYVLENFKQIDIELLDIIVYTQDAYIEDSNQREEFKNSALYVALSFGNNRSVETILKFMSQIPNMDSS